jgi:L-asparaginase/Glu-tRNA(Gln) amidotransferase subunit D
MTPDEKKDLEEFDRDAVEVRFQTRADLLAPEMNDEDWIELGKMVADIAAEARGIPRDDS